MTVAFNFVWLTQKLLADLYQVSVKTVNEYLQNIYEDELSSEATNRKFRIVQIEGKRQVSRLVDHYRLEAILAVGFINDIEELHKRSKRHEEGKHDETT